ncbi:double zinc ribbon and ankyrin repeat-containing protein 1 [Neopelma chrysocephalum]|uniref:double zinc ribbon and ankyrin repeat-containing protein 1 n=1 Tax=Neopelma chrysocephalum TaxID=114329 RepID=UPI000FCD01DF|nr:double zinc ribbon and ankyrin repeat-containing protein 1 [Neopelma chrysocephalum]
MRSQEAETERSVPWSRCAKSRRGLEGKAISPLRSVPQVIPLRIPLPGKAKHEIDTNTLIEIKSDTPEVSIYYTLDGSKPELIRKPGYGECNTFKYKGPIILPVGKIVLKALAVTKDCRKSTVVTKVFLVEYKQANILFSVEDDDKNFLKDIATQNKEGGMFTTKSRKNGLNMEIKPAWGEAPQDFQERKTSHRSLQGPQLLASHLGTTEYREESVSAPPTESLQFASSSAVTSQKSLASTQVSRIQRETDFLKCAHCSAPHLSNLLAHFCQKCGSPIPPVPVHRFPLPEGRQMAPCLECRHPVPMNTPTCIVCEAPQLQPQNNTCIKGKVICQVCGTRNPLHHKHCATCESKLPEIQTAKQLQAQFAWQPHPVSMTKSRPELTEREDKGTQTIGLFYPSSKQLEKKELELISQKEKLEKMSDHKPLLTAISPGKGYWRKQLDHVCAHLRSYAQNNLEFRALIGEPRMGKINSATICEDDYEVTITLNYVLAINKDIHTNKPVKFSSHYLNTVTEVRDGQDRNQTSFGKDDCNLFHSRGKIKRTKSRTLTGQEDKLSPESRQLLDELGPNGKGRITFIEQLLSEGADPNCISDEDQPALTVAVLNKHTEAISLLVQKGANIDQQSGLHNNTALHEAVLLGLEGQESIRVLLRCNANTQKKNAEGQSAYDLAVTTGNNEVISLFQVRLDRERWTNL